MSAGYGVAPANDNGAGGNGSGTDGASNERARTDRVGSGLSVVVIDDHPRVRSQLVGLIEAYGFTVLAAVATCADGRRAVTTLRPDIAVIDNRLPDGLGSQLCVELAEPCPDVIKIIHTGAITSAQAEYATAHGAAAIALKSIRADRLITVMRELTRAGN